MHDLPLITTIAAGFTAALVLGLVTQRLGLSPIVGYLLAGIVIGPHTPGFTGDVHLAQQLAEVGVILLMFGVGMHFHLKDLYAVRWIAIPGALGQSLIATLLGLAIWAAFGWSAKAGIVMGMAMAVASTVVLIRMLMDHKALTTPAGHAAVGWLIVEDILTVVFLVLLPLLASAGGVTEGEAAGGSTSIWASLGWALLKLGLLVAIVLLAGSRIIPWMLVMVARLRSRELLTLTILVLSISVAAASYQFFGASMALGAFLAGVVVSQSPVSQQAGSDLLPLRDAFAVLFFVSVGMLVDPKVLIEEPLMVGAALGVVIIAKPLAAMAIVAVLGRSVRTGLVVAIGLAQIGEFSFILAEVARRHEMMPEAGYSVLVAAAIVSITLNPLLFGLVEPAERWIRATPWLWKLLGARAERRLRESNAQTVESIATLKASADHDRSAVVIGFGLVGQTVDRLLRQAGLRTVVIDTNMDTVSAITKEGRHAIFGDATSAEVLEQAGVVDARFLVVTMAANANPAPVVMQARRLNPDMHILVRTRYVADRGVLERAGVTATIFEEAEAAIALGRAVLVDLGADQKTIDREVAAIRRFREAPPIDGWTGPRVSH